MGAGGATDGPLAQAAASTTTPTTVAAPTQRDRPFGPESARSTTRDRSGGPGLRSLRGVIGTDRTNRRSGVWRPAAAHR